MNRNQIQVGQEYAFKDSTHAQAHRVRYIEPAIVPASGSYSYRIGEQSGYLVEFLDEPNPRLSKHEQRKYAKGALLAVTGRQLVSTWAAEQVRATGEQAIRDLKQAEEDLLTANATNANELLSNLHIEFPVRESQTITSTTLFKLICAVAASARLEARNVYSKEN